ncbi:MAG: ATP-binding protein [Gemmatimonadaceae bacterium]|nr:ATP-binding protein [Gemmatimonadaceae bacterium]
MTAVEVPLLEPRTVFFSVDEKHVLRNASRYFASVQDALAELVQNAFRAGARHLWVRADSATRTIAVGDDGRGCADPETLIRFGGTGWDEAAVVEPAGIGAFALLGIAKSVSIISVHGHRPRDAWRLTIGADVLAGGLANYPLTVEPASVPDDTPRGFTVVATLRDDQQWPSLDGVSLSWRHYFPLTLTLDVDGAVRELPAPTIPAVASFATPVGRLHVLPASHAGEQLGGLNTKSPLLPVWEHRAAAAVRRERLFPSDTRYTPCEDAVISAIAPERWSDDGCLFIWEVNAACGVRPQLPDRNALIEDAALDAALATLRTFILATVDYDHVAAQFARLTDGAPMVGVREYRAALAKDAIMQATRVLGVVHLDQVRPAAFLARVGYEARRGVVAPRDAEFNLYEDDGWRSDFSALGREVFVRPLHRFGGYGRLLELGIPVSADTEAQPATLRLACDAARYVADIAMLLTTGLRVETLTGHKVRDLDSFWDGDGTTFTLEEVGLDARLVREAVDADHTSLCGILNLTSWDNVLGDVRTHGDFAGLAIHAAESELDHAALSLGDYVARDGDSWYIQHKPLVADALACVGKFLGGDAASISRQMAALEELRGLMTDGRVRVVDVTRAEAARVPDAVLSALRELLTAGARARAAFVAAARNLGLES